MNGERLAEGTSLYNLNNKHAFSLSTVGSSAEREDTPPENMRRAIRQGGNLHTVSGNLNLRIRTAVDYKSSGAVIPLLLVNIIFVATGLDYIWLGPIPLWLMSVCVGLSVLILNPVYSCALNKTIRSLALPVVLPWITFSLLAVLSDLYNNALDASFSKIVLLNLLTLLLLLITATLSSLVDRRVLILLLGVIAMIQGTLAIAQYLEFENAWTLPDILVSYSSRVPQTVLEDAPEKFAEVGRVRGTHIFVHKFTPFQGILVAYLLVLILTGHRATGLGKTSYLFIASMVVIGLLGLLLTFSRSTLVGVVVTLLAILATKCFSHKRFGVIICAASLCSCVFVASQYLDIANSSQFSRLFDFESSSNRNQLRLNIWTYGLGAFSRSPLIGEGFLSGMGSSYLPNAIHSVSIRVLASYGILGALFYSLVLVGIFRSLWAGLKAQTESQVVMALAGICAFMVGLIDASTHTSGLLWLDVAQPALVGVFLGQAAVQYNWQVFERAA